MQFFTMLNGLMKLIEKLAVTKVYYGMLPKAHPMAIKRDCDKCTTYGLTSPCCGKTSKSKTKRTKQNVAGILISLISLTGWTESLWWFSFWLIVHSHRFVSFFFLHNSEESPLLEFTLLNFVGGLSDQRYQIAW